MTTIPVLERNIHQVMSWVYAIEKECHWEEDNQKRAFAALRCVLHELRDALPLENAIHLSAQLPLIVRGLFFENWLTHDNQPKIKKKEDFLDDIADELSIYPDIDVEDVTRGVLTVLRDRISRGEIEKVIAVLPSHIKDLFN